MATVATFLTPAVIAAALGILGTLAGWLVKRYIMKVEAQQKTDRRQADEQKAGQAFDKKAADEAATVNASKAKQDQAAKDFFEGSKPAPKP